ncbi:MOSC domain-containing protein [Palleronia sp. KMU-117]|uniref:MOSC domain-containing protein n=1 Tax=Palleronia sp. KMU-117 TaxID=3434108 RepID=UPI003D70BA07
MTVRLAQIWRHPLKALGREGLSEARLEPAKWLPFDRLWAVEHAAAKPGDGWRPKANFLRGVSAPALMAVTARLDEVARRLSLDHPEAGRVEIAPDDPRDWPMFLDWLTRIWPADLPAPTAVAAARDAHLTDVPEPWISINGLSSHRAVEGRVGHPLSIHRWRGNLWIDGLAPWEEFEWPGREIRIGAAVLRVEERITRCKATMANPDTGRRDVDTLAALRSWDHQDFGVYASVVEGGKVRPGDKVEVL